MSRMIRSRRAAPEQDLPLYARLLGLRQLTPSGFLCFVFLEGTVALGVLLALAELVSWWGVLVLPLTVAGMVKLNDMIAGALSRPATATAATSGPAAGRRPLVRPAAVAASAPAPVRSEFGMDDLSLSRARTVDLSSAVGARMAADLAGDTDLARADFARADFARGADLSGDTDFSRGADLAGHVDFARADLDQGADLARGDDFGRDVGAGRGRDADVARGADLGRGAVPDRGGRGAASDRGGRGDGVYSGGSCAEPGRAGWSGSLFDEADRYGISAASFGRAAGGRSRRPGADDDLRRPDDDLRRPDEVLDDRGWSGRSAEQAGGHGRQWVASGDSGWLGGVPAEDNGFGEAQDEPDVLGRLMSERTGQVQPTHESDGQTQPPQEREGHGRLTGDRGGESGLPDERDVLSRTSGVYGGRGEWRGLGELPGERRGSGEVPVERARLGGVPDDGGWSGGGHVATAADGGPLNGPAHVWADDPETVRQRARQSAARRYE